MHSFVHSRAVCNMFIHTDGVRALLAQKPNWILRFKKKQRRKNAFNYHGIGLLSFIISGHYFKVNIPAMYLRTQRN